MGICTFYIYRLGLSNVDQSHRRFFCSETWMSSSPPSLSGGVDYDLAGKALELRDALKTLAGYESIHWNGFADLIFPRKLSIYNPEVTVTNLLPNLNANAPEAAFRLQRVGASVSGSKGIGRICFPILSDAHYLDLPHRRLIDTSVVAPAVAAGIETFAKSFTVHGRTFTNVVWNRGDFTYTPVDHYNLLPNPVRIWDRAYQYHFTVHPSDDRTFVPTQHFAHW